MRYSGKMMGMGHEFSVTSMTNLFVTLTEVLLLVRVIVHFFFTTASGSFFSWVYSTTNPLLSPIRAVFTNATATPSHWSVDFPALFAMAVYAAFGGLLVGLAAWNWGTRRGR
jgi:uncharacterized protein YggT (Ycf19 family)